MPGSTTPANLDVTTFDGTNGLTLLGGAAERIGFSLAVGDINGDGLRDLVIGAPRAERADPYSTQRRGRVYVIFGQESGNGLPWCSLAEGAQLGIAN